MLVIVFMTSSNMACLPHEEPHFLRAQLPLHREQLPRQTPREAQHESSTERPVLDLYVAVVRF